MISTSGDIGSGEESGTITLVNTTIAGNRIDGLTAPAAFGGGLSGDNLGLGPFDSELRATNTIIAGNTVGGATEDCALVNTTTTANNISSDAKLRPDRRRQQAEHGGRPGAAPQQRRADGHSCCRASDQPGGECRNQRRVPLDRPARDHPPSGRRLRHRRRRARATGRDHRRGNRRDRDDRHDRRGGRQPAPRCWYRAVRVRHDQRLRELDSGADDGGGDRPATARARP